MLLLPLIVIENLYKTAHEYANLAGRSHAIATDLKLAGEDNGLDVSQLRPVKRKAHKRKKSESQVISMFNQVSYRY